jgi:hypothetical protein
MSEARVQTAITFREFLEGTPPGQLIDILDLGGHGFYLGNGIRNAHLSTPEIVLHCESKTCSGERIFKGSAEASLGKDVGQDVFVNYICKNCSSELKTFALHAVLDDTSMQMLTRSA